MSYHRQVLDYLADTYGVVDAKITHGGSHPKLTFTYNNKRCHVTLQRDANRPTLFNMKRQDLRRLLGPPPGEGLFPEQPTQKRSLDEMTAELQTKAGDLDQAVAIPATAPPASIVVMGKMCRYYDRLKFIAPGKIGRALKGKAVNVTRESHDSWKISLLPPTRKTPQIRVHQGAWELEQSAPDLSSGLEVFGPSPAEYLMIGDEVLVRLLTDELVPLRRHYHLDKPATSATTVAVEAASPLLVTGSELAQMHAVLVEIRRIEQFSLYRLVKLAGKDNNVERWVFRAPLIE